MAYLFGQGGMSFPGFDDIGKVALGLADLLPGRLFRNSKSSSAKDTRPKVIKDKQGNVIPAAKGLNASNAALLDKSISGDVLGGGRNKKSSGPSYDPLASQLQFMQLIQPFIQAGVQEAVATLKRGAQGMADTANMYGQYGITGGDQQAQNIRNQGIAMAEYAGAAPQYEMFMQLLQMLREEQMRRYEENAQFQAQLNQARNYGQTAAPGGNAFQQLVGLLGP